MNQPGGNQRDFLGVGWKFPLQVAPGGQIAQARYEQRIEESIYLILSTAKGERVMLPEFGCGIHDLVFAPSSPQSVGQKLPARVKNGGMEKSGRTLGCRGCILTVPGIQANMMMIASGRNENGIRSIPLHDLEPEQVLVEFQ